MVRPSMAVWLAERVRRPWTAVGERQRWARPEDGAAVRCWLVRVISVGLYMHLQEYLVLALGTETGVSRMCVSDSRLAVYANTVTGLTVVASTAFTVLVPRAQWHTDLWLVIWKRCFVPPIFIGALGAAVASVPIALPSRFGVLFASIGVEASYWTTADPSFAYEGMLGGYWLAGKPIAASPAMVAVAVFVVTLLAGALVYAVLFGLRYSRYTMYGRVRRSAANP